MPPFPGTDSAHASGVYLASARQMRSTTAPPRNLFLPGGNTESTAETLLGLFHLWQRARSRQFKKETMMKRLITAVTMATPYRAGLAQTPGTTNMDILRQKVKADKKLVVAENLKLTDAEGAKFWPV